LAMLFRCAVSCCLLTFYSTSLPFSCFFFSSRRRHTRSKRDWSSDVCSSDLSCQFRNRTFCFGRVVVRNKILPVAEHVFTECLPFIFSPIDAACLQFGDDMIDELPERPQIGRASCRERV